MLEVSNLSRSYGDFLAVDNVSFSIEPGEIAGLLGHNGAGKTTIMKMLSGYLEPDDGRILIDGIDITLVPKKVQKTLGYLPENLPIYQEMVVADYLDYAAELKGLEGDFKRAEIRRVVEATDIREKLLAPIGTLSRGYKQRVGVAQAILGNPRLLILDEPTSGLDPTQTEHMRNLIRRLAQQATVIISTHIMQEVDALCDRVLIVESGRLLIDERLDELKLSHELEVSTDLPPGEFKPLFEQHESVNAVQLLPGSDDAPSRKTYTYILTVDSAMEMDGVSSAVAARLVDKGASLFRLRPVVRSLETLFREISESQVHSREDKEDMINVA